MVSHRITAWAVVLIAGFASIGCEKAAVDAPRADVPQADTRDQAEPAAKQELPKVSLPTDRELDELNGMRRDYANTINRVMSDDDDEVALLQIAAYTSEGAAKGDYERALDDLARRRETLRGDLPAIASATLADWNSVKAKVDDDLDEAAKSLHAASTATKNLPRQTTAAR